MYRYIAKLTVNRAAVGARETTTRTVNRYIFRMATVVGPNPSV